MKILFYQEIEYGEIPRYWWLGVAWSNYNRATFTLLIIPFNHLARWGRNALYWVRQPREDKRMIENYRVAYRSGYDDGVRATSLKWEESNQKMRAELLKIKEEMTIK